MAARTGRSGPDELPDPRRWTARLARSALECLHGRRPVQQLVRWTAEPVYRDLTRRAVAQEAASAERPRIRALRVCRVTPSVAEASVVVQLGPTTRAVVLRLEADDGRWLCTAFDLVEPHPAGRGKRGASRPRSRGATTTGTG
ncbi:Rv3235 family protein [Jiangella rhizosphaerae]|uniref:3-hydroxyacyl-CoA dehydrogenase n=1 Tax=Jiangella rhizosphaerae TaxID=2293569 RepID=A0A418KKD6_9ACTN|nr:Rv3235 family protein [Jiangella rhizosphaerae]RIQ16371.1 3-hydroxyacyl-CoA dehydrogenase [Jiangella rhizosphaerae]